MKSISERIRGKEQELKECVLKGDVWKMTYSQMLLLEDIKKDLLAEVRRLDKDIQKTEFMGKTLLKAQISKLKEIIGDDESGGGKGKTGSEMDVVHGHDASVDVVVKASLHNPVREGSNPSTVPNCRSADLDAIKKKWWKDFCKIMIDEPSFTTSMSDWEQVWDKMFEKIDELIYAYGDTSKWLTEILAEKDKEIERLQERVEVDRKQICKSIGILIDFCSLGGSTLTELATEAVKQFAELKKENERLIEEMNYQAGCYLD